MAAERWVTVGSDTIPLGDARQIVEEYTTAAPDDRPSKADFYAWPYYDSFDSGVSRDELSDGDLLTPVLLNVNPGIHGFAGLQRIRPMLECHLAAIPSDVDLAEAADAEIDAVSRLFGVLDDHRVVGIRGTTLSKVLHRKRPRLIPLHDRLIHSL